VDKDKLMERLRSTFLEELEGGVKDLNRDLLALEKEPAVEARLEIHKTLFRTAHSLKGASRSVNLHVIEEACNRMEEMLSKIRDGQESFTPDLLRLFFEAADALEDASRLLRQKKDLSGSALEDMIPRLTIQGSASPSPSLKNESVSQKVTPPLPAENFVKITPEKMDQLMMECGGLLTAQRRSELRTADLAGMIDTLGHWKEEWNGVDNAIRKFHSPKAEAAFPVQTLPERVVRVLRRSKDRMRELENGLERLSKGMIGDARALEQTSGLLNEGIRRARMLPFSEACEGLERIIRDMTVTNGKEVEFILKGGEVELDRAILDKLRDPLFHLIRNAVDHGLEKPEER